jgi:type IV secretory pathway VirB9-like protein
LFSEEYQFKIIDGLSENKNLIETYQNDYFEFQRKQRELEKLKNTLSEGNKESDRNISDLPISSLDQLHLDSYRVKGNAHLAWYPTRVFDDGTHVYIQMPDSMNSSDSPALVLIDRSDKTQLVNYRVKKATQGGNSVTYYVVDKIFEKAALIVGVGSQQLRVEIIRNS